jgi:predicted NBD/HSP70 family sugar kinase
LGSGQRSAARVISTMIAAGASSRREVEAALGRSKASVSRTVDRLLKQGYVTRGPKRSAEPRGRKTTSLQVRPDLVYLIGTDLEGRAVRACILDGSRRVITTAKEALGARWSVERILECWVSLLEKMIAESGVPTGKIAGVGAGLPGIVRREGLCTRAYLPPGHWVDLDVGTALSRLGLPIAAANNVVCVSDYERRLGAARGVKSFLSIVARYGLGAAFCGNGSLLMGEETLTCEFGHMRIDLNGPKCICGRRGCLDVFAAGRTMPTVARRRSPAWKPELAKRSRMMGVGIANLLKLFHPQMVILNGIYNDYESEVAPVLTKALGEELGGLGLAVPKVVFGENVEFKVSIGAALRAGDVFLARHLLKNVLGAKPSRRLSRKA